MTRIRPRVLKALGGAAIALGVFTLLGWARETGFRVAVMMATTIALLGAVVIGMAASLERSERARRTADEERARLRRQLGDAEGELRRAKEASDAARRELDAFSYSVSHDLRAPLRSIDGFSQALIEDLGERLDDVARDHVGRVRRSAQRMAQLIDDLLALSRVTRAELQRQPVDLTTLAREVAAALATTDQKREVRFIIADDLQAMADPRLVRGIFEDLLENAWKFTARRPAPTIEVGKSADADGHPHFFVRDDGAGFDMAYSDKLFGAFQRLHHHSEFEGTGIGLAKVQRIVSRHGGRIWAEGRVDGGAVFRFTLSEDR